MANTQNSSSLVQMEAEAYIFEQVEKLLGIRFEKNPKIRLANDGMTYIQPDFYNAEHGIIGEIFAHIGKPKKAQDNKIANDILKMLLLDKIQDKVHEKYIVVCDPAEKKKLEGKSTLAESIRQFGIKILPIEIPSKLRQQILHAQSLQKMTNAE